MYQIVDVSDWTKDYRRIASGTREKFFLFEPFTNNSFLFKIPKENTGEAWAEKIASELGKLIGLKMMDVTFAMHDSRLGVLLRNFVNRGSEQFFDGGDIIKAVDPEFDPKSLSGYNITNILRAIEPFREYNVHKAFIQMLIFDALIGNQDRHCENWGVIQSQNGFVFAPIFDNGASLGFHLEQERINKMFKDGNMFRGFTRRSKTLISTDPDKKKTKMLILLNKIKILYPNLVKESLQSLNQLTQARIEDILIQIPISVMPLLYKDWVCKLVLYRKDWLKTELGVDKDAS